MVDFSTSDILQESTCVIVLDINYVTTIFVMIP